MSDIDDLEDVAEQQRYGFNEPKRGVTKGSRMSFLRSQRRGAKENQALGKQQCRSTDRRGVLVNPPNQD